ncbi:hypothetical protein PIB30_021312 [Stylosanthes scabra]|uniref:Uncharacterized protein n=1 Tax=Stylosanthes scabra TaxID=79078 RepID=A0ABU6Z8H3_9FABA|nr:hypothetical protein [Stylosanthes scabra]
MDNDIGESLMSERVNAGRHRFLLPSVAVALARRSGRRWNATYTTTISPDRDGLKFRLVAAKHSAADRAIDAYMAADNGLAAVLCHRWHNCRLMLSGFKAVLTAAVCTSADKSCVNNG